VKRRELLRHLDYHGCSKLREGGGHTVYLNPRTRKVSTVPRHREINDYLARKICRDLEVPEP
jgi:mRNA interferase HicA